MSRPEKNINWEVVENLLIAGCLGTEIAAQFDMHPDTFYRRVEQQYGMGFTDYSSEKRCKGNSLIRAKQFEKAVKKGDNVQLIWLGKNRLGQKDTQDTVIPNQANLDITHELLEENKKLREQIEELNENRRISRDI
jgi:hypothetical protein